jgi:hypothetical protein
MEDKTVTGWTGWVAFASIVLMIEGVIQFFYGLGAIFNQHWFVTTQNATYYLNTAGWGWTLLLFSVLLFISGALLMSGNAFGRTMGVIFAALSLVANVAVFPAAPVWATLAILVNLLVMYAIVAHGSEMKQLSHT